MILKSFETQKINFINNNLILIYGKNEGHKSETIIALIQRNKEKEIISYHEKQILENQDNFFNNVFSSSLFNNDKLIIINYVSDKILRIVNELLERNLKNILIVLSAGVLEKKSKLRSLFEKNKELICIPFYPDNSQILSKISSNFFKKEKISISQSDINLIVSMCNGDRLFLKNELEKIELYTQNKKKISNSELIKLINLTENHSISELIDNCLIKNQRKTIKILNENNFSNDDCILIIRTFLNKLKRILKLSKDYEENKNLDKTISGAKPIIFWKDKEIITQQLKRWKTSQINELIYHLNEIELQVKRNSFNSINIVSNFILEKSLLKS